MDPDGSNQLRIRKPSRHELGIVASVFSPDGRKILFSRDSAENPCYPGAYQPAGCGNLYVINADGTGLTQITSDGFSWAGHGRRMGAGLSSITSIR